MQWFPLALDQAPYWEKNRPLLQKHHPELLDRLLLAEERLSKYEFALETGLYLVRERQTGLEFYPSASLPSHQQTVLDHAMTFFQRGTELLIICGCGLGYMSSELVHHLPDIPQKSFLLLETRPELILAQLALCDREALLAAERVFWAVGDDPWDALCHLCQHERLYVVPEAKIATLPERNLSPDERTTFRQISAWFHQFKQSMHQRMMQNRVNFSLRMNQPPDLEHGTIWAVTVAEAYAHTPLMNALMDGFVDLGWKKHIFTLRSEFAAWHRVYEDLVECAPDLLLVCNTASSVYFKEDIKRPRLVWMLDNPRYFASATMRDELTPRDHVLYIDRSFAPAFAQAPMGSADVIPAHAMIGRAGVARAEWRAPLLFVGSYTSLEMYLQNLSVLVRDEIYALLDGILSHSLMDYPMLIQQLGLREETIKTLQARAKVYITNLRRPFPDPQMELEYFLYAIANSYKREKVIRSLLDLGLVIYGPDSWLPFLGESYKANYRGWMAMHDLPDAYASAEICLNIHSLQCPTCLNPRDFDILAAGGLLLTDWVEDFDRGILAPDMDCVVYRDGKDLRDKVQVLFNDPESRAAIRAQGHQTYLDRHTPRHRAAQILQQIKQGGA